MPAPFQIAGEAEHLILAVMAQLPIKSGEFVFVQIDQKYIPQLRAPNLQS